MTMRLDIVTNDAGELVRREHARDLGAGVVIAIYRLAKLAQLHDLTNQAFIRQLEQTHQIIGDYCLRSGSNVNILFAHKAVFVAGQLLKGSRSTYEAAAELGELFESYGGSEVHIQRDVTREELLGLAEQISIAHRSGPGSFRSPSPKIRLRQVADAARLRGIELEDLTPDQRIVRMYASAVVIMRRFFEDLQASRYILPRRIKRIAQSLVDLSEGSTPSFLGVTEVRNANFDEAGRAVNTSILSVLMAREVTTDRVILAQIAMAAMMHDVSRPRALALMAAAGPAMPGMQGPTTLSEDQEDRLAAGAAAVLTALGRVNEPSITRTVLAFEALWIRRQTWLGPVYWGARSPTLHAKVIAVARRYNDLLTPEPGLPPPTPDYAVAVLSEELKEPVDRTVLRMLVSALGLLPMGTVVQLATGEVAEVVRGPKGPGEKPRVCIMANAAGARVSPVEVELAQEPHRQVTRILGVDGWRKGLELGPGVDVGMSDGERESEPPAAPPPPVQAVAPPPLPPISPLAPLATSPATSLNAQAQRAASQPSRADRYAEQFESWGGVEEPGAERHDSSSAPSGEHSSASLPSMGSSPSAVAEAMGRMINDSLAPPAAVSRDGDRTLFTAGEDAEARATARPAAGRSSSREPTARGNLAATPLPHVLVYMLDHALTGSVVFEGEAGDDTIHFVNGVPTKIKLRDSVALLGEVLVHGGAIDPRSVDQAVDGARRLGILLGEYLVGHDLVTREALSWALEAQLLEKIAYLANLAPEINYSYYRDVDLLDGWGGGDVPVGCPLNPILASVRNWMDRARIRATLNRIGKHPLVLHDDNALANIAVLPEEQAALDLIRTEALPLSQLFKRNLVDEEVVSSLVYTLAVTRQFAFKGQKKGPMAQAGGPAWQVASSPPSANPPPSRSVPAAQPPSAPVGGTQPAPAASGTVSRTGLGSAPSSRPQVPQPVSVSKMASAASGGEVSRAAPNAAVAPPVSVRKAGESRPSGQLPAASPPPGGAPRAMTPAARPSTGGLPRANAPQIRPITAKKATVHGLQPAVPPEQRQSRPAGPLASPAGASSPPDPLDTARTIARPSPAFKPPAGRGAPARAAAPRAGAAAGAGAPPPSMAARPPPGLPSKSAAPVSARPAVSPSPSSGRSGLGSSLGKPGNSAARSPAAAPTAPAPAAKPASSADEIQIELDDGGGRLGSAIDLGDGLADAEAALEAMQSFRMAEAALQRNDIAGAERLARKAVEGDPGQADYQSLLAWVRALNGAPGLVEEAIATMSRVIVEDPSNERALFYRAKLLVRINRPHDALTDLNELLSANPHHREAAAELRALKQRI